jgi:hypothetical protein
MGEFLSRSAPGVHVAATGSVLQFTRQSAHRPRTSITGRTGWNPAALAAARTPPVTLSLSR